MIRPTNQYGTTLLVRGLLVLLCALAVPKLASSEPDVAADHQDILKKYRLLGLDDFDRPRRRFISRVAPDSNGCPVARIDMALERGLLSYSIFLADLPEGEAGQSAKHGGGGYGTTMLIGEKDCVIRIRIERATDLGVYDTRLGDRESAKQLRERLKKEREAQ
jgi:hypothetical protein